MECSALENCLRLFHHQHTAMGMVGNAIGSVAEQPPPKLRMAAMPDDDQIMTAFIRVLHNCLGRMTRARDAADVETVRQFLDFGATLSEMLG